MSIRFECERCGLPIEVDDRLEGKHGHCKHCGHAMVVPAHEPPPDAGLRLKPVEVEEPGGAHAHLLAPPAALNVRHAEADPVARPHAVSDPDAPPRGENYDVLGPLADGPHGTAGPPPFWVNLPTLTARFVARLLRGLRDWLYLISLTFLVVGLIGFLFKYSMLLHVGAVGVIATNISMLCVGIAYLVTLPFKESLLHGLANLFVPFYAVYYWTTRWHRMRTPVLKTLGSFLPVALVGLAYFLYEEGPELEQAAEQEVQVIERKIEEAEGKLESSVGEAKEKEKVSGRSGRP